MKSLRRASVRPSAGSDSAWPAQALGRRAKLHVAKLDLHALDVEAHERAVGEGEHDHARGRSVFWNVTARRFSVAVLVRVAKPEARHLQHAIEAQHAGNPLGRPASWPRTQS